MKKLAYSLAVAGALSSWSAHADVILSSSLQDINGAYGAGVATTTTTMDGKSTTVVGPAGGGNRASGTTTLNTWFQSNVGGGGTVGITSTYPSSGNGSAFYSTTSGDSKADLQYYFGSNGAIQAINLASLTSANYDFYRSSASTVGANLAPVFRLDIAKNGTAAGSLVFENVYQNQQASPVDTWTTLSATLNSGIFWATNAALGPTFADANGGQKTLQAWLDGNAGSTLSVYGMSLGVGSGFNNGIFSGAEDNVSIAFSSGVNRSFNFEVAPGATDVPEPATMTLTLAGLGAFALMRRRKA